ncbi:unnamed protein product [Amaranthus hypochondriacus]
METSVPTFFHCHHHQGSVLQKQVLNQTFYFNSGNNHNKSGQQSNGIVKVTYTQKSSRVSLIGR